MVVRLEHDELNQLLATSLDAMGIAILLHDDEHILVATAAVAKALGAASGASLAGLRLDAFIVPELETVTKERRAYLMRDRVTFTDLPLMVRTLDGRTVRMRVDARAFEYQGRTIGVVMLRSVGPSE